MAESVIFDRGRGPEIAGTRITVYDIVDYLEEGWHPTAIAAFFRISSRKVDAALRYIEEHEEEVRAEYQRILARAAKGNPPELQSQLDAGHARFLEHVRERARASGRGDSECPSENYPLSRTASRTLVILSIVSILLCGVSRTFLEFN